MRVPKNKGSINSNPQGRIRLTNPDGESFLVHVTLGYIWEKADGRNTISDIVDSLVAELELPERQRDAEWDNVSLALRSLEKKGLIEYVEKKNN